MSSAVWGAPWNLRLVVLDIETCVAPDRRHRIVSLGVAVCRDGGIKQRFEWLINPGCELDAWTPRIHKLTDRHLADEPTFDEILPELRRRLSGKPGERVVLAAHNAGFDVGWLRSEVARVKAADLPDLPVLDTYGPLVGLGGLDLRQPKLDALLAALGLENDAPHQALGDATAAALAAIALLDRAAARGHDDLDALLVAATAPSLSTIKRKSSKGRRTPTPVAAAPPIPLAHVETHASELPATPTPTDLDAWRAAIAECGSLRCDGLTSRSGPEPLLRGLLLGALDAAAAAGDRAGAATILGALLPMLGRLPDSIAEMRQGGPPLVRVPGAGKERGVALALYGWLSPRLDPLGRCSADDPCPTCRDGEPCPLDTWRSALVPSALAAKRSTVEAFWDTDARAAARTRGGGRGYLAMRRHAPGLADAALRACLEFHRGEGDLLSAALLAEQVWQEARCTDPAITEARMRRIAAGGRAADLEAALAAARPVLSARKQSTDPAWVSLATSVAILEARQRLLKRRAGEHHHAKDPVRDPRAVRFLRAS